MSCRVHHSEEAIDALALQVAPETWHGDEGWPVCESCTACCAIMKHAHMMKASHSSKVVAWHQQHARLAVWVPVAAIMVMSSDIAPRRAIEADMACHFHPYRHRHAIHQHDGDHQCATMASMSRVFQLCTQQHACCEWPACPDSLCHAVDKQPHDPIQCVCSCQSLLGLCISRHEAPCLVYDASRQAIFALSPTSFKSRGS